MSHPRHAAIRVPLRTRLQLWRPTKKRRSKYAPQTLEFAKVLAEPIKKPEIDHVLSRHRYFDHPANSEAVTFGWIDLSDRQPKTHTSNLSFKGRGK